jgi:hypothetical protein
MTVTPLNCSPSVNDSYASNRLQHIYLHEVCSHLISPSPYPPLLLGPYSFRSIVSTASPHLLGVLPCRFRLQDLVLPGLRHCPAADRITAAARLWIFRRGQQLVVGFPSSRVSRPTLSATTTASASIPHHSSPPVPCHHSPGHLSRVCSRVVHHGTPPGCPLGIKHRRRAYRLSGGSLHPPAGSRRCT